MLAEHRITEEQHIRWTNVFWLVTEASKVSQLYESNLRQLHTHTKHFNVWVYKSSKKHPDGVIRHHYKTLTAKGKYFRKCDAHSVGWDYINSHNFSHCF
jgi:hypothetical protein